MTGPPSESAPPTSVQLEPTAPPLDGTKHAREFMLGVHGESYRNDDGSSRQTILARCVAGERIRLIREPENQFDSEAVRVCRENGEQIGYLPRDSRLGETIRSGRAIAAVLWQVGGGTPDKPLRGAVVRIYIW